MKKERKKVLFISSIRRQFEVYAILKLLNPSLLIDPSLEYLSE
jgi:hypothetical protein